MLHIKSEGKLFPVFIEELTASPQELPPAFAVSGPDAASSHHLIVAIGENHGVRACRH